ncbi:beta-1,3-glucanase family protein [Microbaculum marinum]|uniref:Beta-1,3-glucanase family protein n=1 Tax=Microbaculum marinum TaxID=1764581 RepID=A0AAW9RIX0_9HYPH
MTAGIIRTTKLALFSVAVAASAFVAPTSTWAATNNQGMQLVPATFVNNSGIDAQVYVAIIGNSGSETLGTFQFYSATGKNGDVRAYTQSSQSTNIGYMLKLGSNNKTKIMVPQLQSGRMYFSLYSPLNVTITRQTYNYPSSKSGPNTGTYYAIRGPTGWNTADPNYATPYDWVELNWNAGTGPRVLFVNTTQVDMFGLPLKLTLVSGTTAKSKETVGATPTTWGNVYTALDQAGSPWTDLIIAPHGHQLEYLRVISPEHGINTAPYNFPADQLDSYIGSVFAYYQKNELKITYNNVPYVGTTGTVRNQPAIIFNEKNSDAIMKPTTLEVYMNEIPSSAPSGVTDLFAASLLRSTLLKDSTPSDCNTKTYYKYPPVNVYAKVFHRYSIGRLSYAMPYDDTCNQSTTLSGVPRKLSIVLQPMDIGD